MSTEKELEKTAETAKDGAEEVTSDTTDAVTVAFTKTESVVQKSIETVASWFSWW